MLPIVCLMIWLISLPLGAKRVDETTLSASGSGEFSTNRQGALSQYYSWCLQQKVRAKRRRQSQPHLHDMLLTSEKPSGKDEMSSHRNTHIVCGSHWKLFIVLWRPLASTEDGNFISPVCHKEVNDSKNVEHRNPRIVRHDHKHDVKHVGVALPEWVFSTLNTIHLHIRKSLNQSYTLANCHFKCLRPQRLVDVSATHIKWHKTHEQQEAPAHNSSIKATSLKMTHGKCTS